MNWFAGPEADGIEYSKIEKAPPFVERRLLLGAGPHFKRKRSFWRALRRGEVWVFVSHQMYANKARLAAEMFGGAIPEANFIADKSIPNDNAYIIRRGPKDAL